MRKMVVMTMMTAGLAMPAVAQDSVEKQVPEKAATLKRELDSVQSSLAALAVQSRVIAGAPYSAEATTETNQVLSDGNRIARKTLARIFRDGEGRTRREELDPDTGAVRSATISDPVSHTTFTLDPVNRVAYRTGVLIATPAGVRGRIGGAAEAGGAFGRGTPGEVKERTPIPPSPTRAPVEGDTLPRRILADSSQTTTEDLGQQTIEGVMASGQRTTSVIPAGAIGNLQPLKVVAEQWTATELKVLVLTKHSDPRSGESTYRLSNIVRAEPDRSLFVVPSDYTVKEQPIRRPQ